MTTAGPDYPIETYSGEDDNHVYAGDQWTGDDPDGPDITDDPTGLDLSLTEYDLRLATLDRAIRSCWVTGVATDPEAVMKAVRVYYPFVMKGE